MSRAAKKLGKPLPFKQLDRIELQQKLTSLRDPASDADASDLYEVEIEAQNRDLQLARQLFEDALDIYSERYDNSPTASFTFCESGSIVALNLTAARLLGEERESLIGKPFIRSIHQGSIAAFLSHIRVVQTRRGKAVTYVQLAELGSKTIILISQLNSVGDGSEMEIQTSAIDEADLRVD